MTGEVPPLEHAAQRRFRLPQWLPPLVFALAASVVLAPYRDAPFVLDAIYYDLTLALIRLGRATWPEYILAAHGGYPHPLWKLLWYAMRQAFGDNAVAWHVVFGAVQVASSWALYALVSRYAGTLAGWIAGFLWAAVAIGGYDNALLWSSNSEQVVAVALLAIGMLFVPAWSVRPWIAGFATMGCVVSAVLVWGLIACAAPVIFVQYVLLERPRLGPAQRAQARHALVPVGLGLALAMAFTAMAVLSQSRADSALQLSAAAVPRFFEQLAVPLSNLLFFSPASAATTMPARYAVLVAVLAALTLARPEQRRAAIVFGLIALAYVAVLVLFRATRDLGDGRYRYVPSLSWAVLLGIGIAALAERLPARLQRAALAGLMIAGCGYLAVQHRTAVGARREFDGYFQRTTVTAFAEHRQLLQALATVAQQQQQTIRLPELPVAIPPYFQPVFYPLSALFVQEFPAGLPGIEVVSPDQVTDADVARALQLVESSHLPAAREWALRWRTVLPELQALDWLSAFAGRTGQTIALPPLVFSHADELGGDLGLQLPVDQCLRFAFPQPPPHLTLEAREPYPPQQAASVLAHLRADSSSMARQWERVFAPYAAGAQ